MYAAVKTIVTLCSLILFIDRSGRRKLLLYSSAGMIISMWYLGAFVTAAHIDLASTVSSGPKRSAGGWVAIVAVYVYAVSCLISHPLSLNFITNGFSLLGILLHSLERSSMGLLC